MTILNLFVLTQLTTALVFADQDVDSFSDSPKYVFPMDRKEDGRRILGGTPVPKTGFSFAVALQNKRQTGRCTGSIIAPTFVLTAAHCKDMYYVRKATKDNQSRDHKIYEAKAYIVHPQFTFTTVFGEVKQVANDISLLQTSENMVQGWVQAVPLSTAPFKSAEGSLGTAAGFGRRGMFTTSDPNDLRQVMLKLQACPDKWTVTICGVTPPEATSLRSICVGDSGGPMIYDGKILGVTSLGPGVCTAFAARELSLSVFTLVSAYVPWIQEEMRKRSTNTKSDLSFALPTVQPQPALRDEGIKSRDSDHLKNTNFEEKIIYQDVYFNHEPRNLSISLVTVFSVLLIKVYL